jgi:hypothetical protein
MGSEQFKWFVLYDDVLCDSFNTKEDAKDYIEDTIGSVSVKIITLITGCEVKVKITKG